MFSWNGNERNRLLINMGDGRFAEAATAYGMDSLRDARGLAASDFDGDGDIDFIVNNYNGEAEYFVNESARGHWLRVRLRGRESNRDGIGAVIRLRAGGLKQMRVITAGDGYASQCSRVAHFGLGHAAAADLEITWPSGVKQAFRDIAADRVLEIDEGSETMGVVHVGNLEQTDRR